MKLRVTLRNASDPRDVAGSADVAITTDAATSVGDVARAIAVADPTRRHIDAATLERLTLAVSGRNGGGERLLPRQRPIGDAEIAGGAYVRLVAGDAPTGSAAASAAVLRVVGGPGRGQVWRLPRGDAVIGRDPACRVMLDDPMVSGRHARIAVGDRVELVDLNSANGILVDGQVVPRVVLGAGVTAVLGQTELQVDMLGTTGGGGEPGAPHITMRPPVVQERFEERTIEPPRVPTEKDKPRFPYMSLVAPVLMGVGMWVITQQIFSLLFVVLAPVMMLGSWIDGKVERARQMRDESAEFEGRLAGLQAELEELKPIERRVRTAEAPAAEAVVASAARRDELLWSRRAEHWNALHVRLGVGTSPSRVRITRPETTARVLEDPRDRLLALIDHYRDIGDVPIVESLADAGNIGLCGRRDEVAAAANGLVAQLTGLHAPTELEIAAIIAPQWVPSFDGYAWLPHARDTEGLGEVHLADSPVAAARVLTALELLLESRSAERDRLEALAVDAGADEHGSDVVHAPTASGTLPAIAVVVTDDAPADRARLIELAERGPSAGVHVLWLAERRQALPGACRTVLDLGEGAGAARIHRVRLGESSSAVAELVSSEQFAAFATGLAGVVDAGVRGAESSDVPRSVSLLALLGPEVAESPAAVVERWRQNESIAQRDTPSPRALSRRGSLRAIVGSAGIDAMSIDLRTDGPHALVGGTTGSGKSEFLQSWVLGVAAGYSPDRVSFLFVDYKGGSAFAECVELPHCVGLVTDLSPRLVLRALTSLRAELHHRERLLGELGAKDLDALERRGDPAAPPSLVLVIDEFAALATDVPEFVDGVVDIAQRGRSLGIHLIMATQRPAGVIRDNLRANTNLRIALRMADAHDSQDVVGDATAAGFDPAIPGRAVAKRGPGRLVPFQSAYAGGRTRADARSSDVSIAQFRFGAETPWEPPKRAAGEEDAGPTDIARLVATVRGAAVAAAIPAPRRPWLDELPQVVALEDLAPRRDDALVLGLADDPSRQSRQSVMFRPDAAGHLAVFGTGGSGKSTALRTIAASAGVTPDGGPVDVYAIDMSGGALRMLRQLPHVASVIMGDDVERVIRLMRVLREELERRAGLFSGVNAGTITEYRLLSGERELPRMVLLLDGYPSFRDEFEGPLSGGAYTTLVRLLQEGRQVGMHVALTADRAGSVPTVVSSAIQQRVVLRQADDVGYQLLDAPRDLLDEASPPGRAIVGGLEVQIAVLGGSASAAEQSAAIEEFAQAQRRRSGRVEWPAPVLALPSEYGVGELPAEVDGKAALGLAEDTLAPLGFDASGVLLLAGPPGSGRTNAARAIAESVRRWSDSVAGRAAHAAGERHLLCPPRSPLIAGHEWTSVSAGVDEVAQRARELLERVDDEDAPHQLVVLEEIGDWLQSTADMPLVQLIKAMRRSPHLLVADGDVSSWVSAWPLMSEVKAGRRGLLLWPEPTDGETILRTSIPRGSRAAPPPGRGVAVLGRRVVRVQLPLVGVEVTASPTER